MAQYEYSRNGIHSKSRIWIKPTIFVVEGRQINTNREISMIFV